MSDNDKDKEKKSLVANDRFWRYFIYFGIVVCFAMTYFQYLRAIGGNQRSWTYVFEWPFLGGIGIWMVWKVRKEMQNPTVFKQEIDDPADLELKKWKEHLESLENNNDDQIK